MRLPLGWMLFFALPLFATETLESQKKALVKKIVEVHKISKIQEDQFTKILFSSPVMGQGNPDITKHPVTREACLLQAEKSALKFENPDYEKQCGAKYMAPMTNGKTKACIDQFEFPNIPCEYPVVWTKASEAAQVCEAMGKRLCDAHEWEGACAGELKDPDYDFSLTKGVSINTGVENMRRANNSHEAKNPGWAYGGSAYQKGICGANSSKANDCNGGDWKRCGSNTYPSGFFPKCKSKNDVYDQHGNAAEHMNLPLSEDQMASRGSKDLGVTEMKGSWFIFDKYYAHKDFCRWRAPYWHGTKVRDDKSHHNYHLGFRCCKNI